MKNSTYMKEAKLALEKLNEAADNDMLNEIKVLKHKIKICYENIQHYNDELYLLKKAMSEETAKKQAATPHVPSRRQFVSNTECDGERHLAGRICHWAVELAEYHGGYLCFASEEDFIHWLHHERAPDDY